MENVRPSRFALCSTEDYAAECEHGSVSPRSLVAQAQLTLELSSHEVIFNPYCWFHMKRWFHARTGRLKIVLDRKESSILHSALTLNRKGFICLIIGLLALFVNVCLWVRSDRPVCAYARECALDQYAVMRQPVSFRSIWSCNNISELRPSCWENYQAFSGKSGLNV